MKLQKLKQILNFLAVLGIIGVFYAFTSNSNKVYEPVANKVVWQNLKVLPQNISKDSLHNLMKGYSISLGVKCNFCHESQKDNPKELDFASDAKIQKEIARGMIKMTDDINKNYFLPHKQDPKPTQTYDVACITCHRGTTNPKEYLDNVGSAINYLQGIKK